MTLVILLFYLAPPSNRPLRLPSVHPHLVYLEANRTAAVKYVLRPILHVSSSLSPFSLSSLSLFSQPSFYLVTGGPRRVGGERMGSTAGA